MSNENEAFEKWYEDQIWGNESWKDGLRLAWQDAKADSAQEIVRLNKVIEINHALMQQDDETIWTLQAHINSLREALEIVSKYSYGLHPPEFVKQALAQTPAQSLQEFENDVIERCAKVCELQRELQYKTGGDENAISQTYRDADAIRALKKA